MDNHDDKHSTWSGLESCTPTLRAIAKMNEPSELVSTYYRCLYYNCMHYRIIRSSDSLGEFHPKYDELYGASEGTYKAAID